MRSSCRRVKFLLADDTLRDVAFLRIPPSRRENGAPQIPSGPCSRRGHDRIDGFGLLTGTDAVDDDRFGDPTAFLAGIPSHLARRHAPGGGVWHGRCGPRIVAGTRAGHGGEASRNRIHGRTDTEAGRGSAATLSRSTYSSALFVQPSELDRRVDGGESCARG